MGQKDSTRTRVAPIFDHLLSRDQTGRQWLPQLLQLPHTGHCNDSGTFPAPSVLMTWGWGTTEVAIEPPRPLLHWLVSHMGEESNIKSPDSVYKAHEKSKKSYHKRKALWDRDQSVVSEALGALAQPRLSYGQKPWYILEGETKPDVYLETPEMLIVIEGKRTECRPTRHTTWMYSRYQMLRHLDCAWEIRSGRRVYGFFIVEGDGGPENVEVPDKWTEVALDTAARDGFEASLPHRTAQERAAIAGSFLGVTTWQRVCTEFGIQWNTLP